MVSVIGRRRIGKTYLVNTLYDHVINLFELKFYKEQMTISKSVADNLQEKMQIFKETTKTTKQLTWVLITTFGLKPNEYSRRLIHKVLTINDLYID